MLQALPQDTAIEMGLTHNITSADSTLIVAQWLTTVVSHGTASNFYLASK